MDDYKKHQQRATDGFYLSEENSKRLLVYVTAMKLKDEKVYRSDVVNAALDLFFEENKAELIVEVAG